VVLLLLWRENMVKGFLFMLHYWETLSTKLLNSLKVQEACVTKMRRNMHNRLGSHPTLLGKICCDELSLFPYKMQLSQPIS
jgi:hypothetical protein